MPITEPATDPQLGLPVDAAVVSGVNITTNVYGVPWIIGAKKGFPNFNGFTMENVFNITRKLQLTRPNTSVTYLTSPNSYTISQQLVISLTNLLDVECWNSYRADYTHAQPMQILATVANTVVLTNDEGLNYPIGSYYANSISTSDWPGYGSYAIPQQTSFLYPLYSANDVVQPESVYTFDLANPFVPPTTDSFVNNTLSPHWGLLVTNRVRVVVLEKNGGLYHVIDYVQLAGPDSSHELTADFQALYDTKINNVYDDQWDTDPNALSLPKGMANQISVSALLVQIRLSPYWIGLDPTWVTNQTAGFRAFLGLGPLPGLPPSAAQYIAAGQAATNMQAPYSPMATVVYRTQWGANDPLVHYMASDLTDLNRSTAALNRVLAMSVGQLNDHYMPWGGNPQFPGVDVNPYNLALKDPLVFSSDAWNFPTNQPLNASWLGQVHRGTPWQTINLKATNILASAGGLGAWIAWTGDAMPADAAAMTPVQDWHLAALLASMFNTNDFRRLFSVNNPDPNAWRGLLDGLTAVTNTASGMSELWTISSNSPQASIIANGIESAQKSQTGQFFEDAGDILAVPQLSTACPFLNLAPANGINDAAYEAIPAQLLSLIRNDSVGSIAAANGQSVIRFTGYDGHYYAIEVSTNLLDWISLGTNSPTGGVLNLTNALSPSAGAQFYRSVLLN